MDNIVTIPLVDFFYRCSDTDHFQFSHLFKKNGPITLAKLLWKISICIIIFINTSTGSSHTFNLFTFCKHTFFYVVSGLIALKWLCHEIDIFWRSKHFNQCFLCMRWWFSRSFKSFSLTYTITFYLLLGNYLINFEKCLLKPSSNSLLCDWLTFSSANLSLAAEKMCKN